MNYNSSQVKMTVVWFYFVNVKGNWAHLAGKNLRPGAKITTMFRLPWKCLNLSIKVF